MLIRTLSLSAVIAAGLAAVPLTSQSTPPSTTEVEKHLRNIRQLTFGGANAEAYFSRDGRRLRPSSATASSVPCARRFDAMP